MTTAELILKHFRGRPDYVAVSSDAVPFEPKKIDEPLKPEWLEARHLAQQQCLGFYVMTAESQVLCSCIDFDNKDERPDPAWRDKTEQVYYLLCNIGMRPVVELSQSGTAAHVWVFFQTPTDAWLVRAFWRAVSIKLGVAFPEVYPRQDQLSGKGLGNLVRYPLWNQSRFVDVEGDWTTLEPEAALGSVSMSSALELKLLAFELGAGELKPEAPLQITESGSAGPSARIQSKLAREHTLLARRWKGDMTGLTDTSRSALALSIACELVRIYIPTPEIEHALRVWCRDQGYEKGDRDDWIARTVTKAYDFVLTRTEKKSTDATTLDRACHEMLDEYKAGRKQYVASGILALDQSIDGLSYGEMAVIGARPGHGKSAFALQWLDAAAKSGQPCLIISEEMSRIELAKRALLSISELEEEHWHEQVEDLRTEVNDYYAERAPIYVQESCNTIDRCEEVIDQFCAVHEVKVVAVDYIQLLGGRESSRYEIVTDISRRLKQAARRNNCAVLALSQLNRAVDSRDSREPKLSDLRESGQVEQDADLIVFLQWPLKFDSKANPEDYRIIVAKRRNGPIRQPRIETKFDPSRQRIGLFYDPTGKTGPYDFSMSTADV